MRRSTDKFSTPMIILYLVGLIPVIWLSLRSAPYFITRGLVGIIENANDIFDHPFRITLVEGSLRVVLLFCFLYGIGTRRKQGSSGSGWDPSASSTWETGMSGNFVSCSKGVKDLLEVPEDRCD